MAIPQPPRMTVAEYLEWEPLQELRYEYVHGTVIAMTGGTVPHNDIALNLYRALYPQVRAKGCRINVADVKVEISSNSPYYYPDIIVTCDSRDLTARKLLRYPKLIVEVLSPGTEAKDRGENLLNTAPVRLCKSMFWWNQKKLVWNAIAEAKADFGCTPPTQMEI